MLVSVITFIKIESVAVVQGYGLSPCLNLSRSHLPGLLMHRQHIRVHGLAAPERERVQERSQALPALRRRALPVV